MAWWFFRQFSVRYPIDDNAPIEELQEREYWRAFLARVQAVDDQEVLECFVEQV